MPRRTLAFALSVLAPVLLCAHAAADDSAAAREEARTRFDRGLARFAERDYAGALAEFERAQALVPNPIVLFNIGLVQAALGRPVEACDALEQVLRAPGELPAERLAHARAVLDDQAQRVAELVVETSAPAAIEVDGVERGRTPLAAPLRIAAGTHVVAALAPGHLPVRREITVAGGARAAIAVELMPADQQPAQVAIASPVPGADVFIDGTRVGRTPLPASLAVAPGTHVIELRRPGYRSAVRELALGEGTSARVELTLEPDRDAAALHGRLALHVSEDGVQVSVDGARHGVYRAPLDLPHGPHRVRIERAGFEPVERDVHVQAGGETLVRVTLPPTPETRQAHVERVRSQRRLGVLATAGGLGLAALGSALGLWGQLTLPELERELSRAEDAYTRHSGSECDPADELDPELESRCIARIEAAAERVDTRAFLRTAGFVAAGAGAALAAAGIVLLATNDDEAKYDRATLSAWLGPDGVGAALRGRF